MPNSITYKKNSGSSTSHTLFLIWIAFFSFAACAAVLFQKLVLPAFPSIHAGMGLMTNDAIYFHNAAKAIAQQIIQSGWSVWSPWSNTNDTGNVTLLAALYALYHPDPLLVLPLNASMHALTGVLLTACGWRLTASRAGRMGSLLAGALYVMLPTSLVWYAQLHKDSYADLAYLLVFNALLILMQSADWRSRIRALLQIFLAAGLIVFVRPQYLLILIAILLVGALPAVIQSIRKLCLQRLPVPRQLAYGLISLLLAVVSLCVLYKLVSQHIAETKKGIDIENYVVTTQSSTKWEDMRLLPESVNRQLEKIGRIREHMLEFDKLSGTRSTYDPQAVPHSSADVLLYAPRAFWVTLMAPFPSDWLKPKSAMQVVGIAETVLFYAILPGVFWFARRRLTVDAMGILLPALFAMLLLGLANSNLGNLHRIRYPFHFISLWC